MTNSDLRMAAGQSVMVGIHGPSITPELTHLIRDLHVGGVCYFRPPSPAEFDDTIESLEAVRETFYRLRHLSPGEAGPLWIATDHEGGRVQRLRAPLTRIPPMALVGEYLRNTRDESSVRALASLMARELRWVGINWNFAPVADVLSEKKSAAILDRAFGEDPDAVSAAVSLFISEWRREGLLSCTKHFPGHGSVRVDSHLELPVVERSVGEMDRCDLAPFRAAIRAKVPAIMIAHLAVPAWGIDGPASLSRAVITDHLRGELQFSGLVVSDDLSMKAISIPTEEAATAAWSAGTDIILICHAPESQIAAVEALIRLFERIRPTEWTEIESRVKRLEKAKKKMILSDRPAPISELHAIQKGATDLLRRFEEPS